MEQPPCDSEVAGKPLEILKIRFDCIKLCAAGLKVERGILRKFTKIGINEQVYTSRTALRGQA